MRRMTRGALAGWVALACALPLAGQTASSTSSNTSQTVPASADVVTLPAGQKLSLELQGELHTRHNRKGDRAAFSVPAQVSAGAQPAIPAGSEVRATLSKVSKPGLGGGAGKIRFEFNELILPDGTTVPLEAKLVTAGFYEISRQGRSVKGERSGAAGAATVGLNAGLGALLGAQIGGKKGAAYGAGVGAGIGVIDLLAHRGPHLELPAGTIFEIELTRSLAIPRAALLQLAQQAAPPASGPAPGASVTPSEVEGPASAASEPIPEFPSGDDSTLATNRVPPPAPPFDPALDHPDAFKMRVDVPLVLVEAFVRDARGRPLEDLTRDDFRLWEDGVEQKIQQFSRDELPLAVALVVDRSGSVAPYMSELRQAAYQTLTQLKPGDQVGLFAFDADVERLENLTTDRRRIAERIARIRAVGGTNITDALFAAAQYLHAAAPDRRRAIILISDNQATVRGAASQGRVIRVALEAGVVIYSIKTPGEPTPLMMRLPVWLSGTGSVNTITRETGGEIIDVDHVGSLAAAMRAVIARLKTRYTLGYHSTNQAEDGSFRQIEVRLTDRFGRRGDDYFLHARKGYYAPREQVASTTP